MKKFILFIFLGAVLSAFIIFIKSAFDDYEYTTEYFNKDFLALKAFKYSEYDRPRAIKYYERTIKLGNKNRQEYCILAGLYSEEKKSETAKKYYKIVISELDLESVEILNKKYIKDKNSVYHFCSEIENSDSETFEIMSDNNDYSKDKNNVYYMGEKLEEVDSESFQILGTGSYTKDKMSIYYHNKKVEDADTETFETINDINAEDKNNYYEYGKVTKKK